MTKNTLATDMGRHSGLCYSTNKGIKYELLNIANIRNLGRRLHRLYTSLESICTTYNIEHIVYEQPVVFRFHGGTRGGFLYESQLLKLAYILKISVESTSISTIKKHITGSGKASKESMIYNINEHFNLNISDDNIADAIALFDYHEPIDKTLLYTDN